MEIVERAGLATIIILAGIFGYLLWTRFRLRWIRGRGKHEEAYAGLEGLRHGVPAILYFTTPNCAPCRAVQRPAIEDLQAQYGDRLQIVTIDASAHPELADYWGVLSVPTTFIIDSHGQPRHVNNGVATAAKLWQQLITFGSFDRNSGGTSNLLIPGKGKA